jgi:hypothetical protein
MKSLYMLIFSFVGTATLVTGCTQDLTQLVVMVTSDYSSELHSVGIDIEDPNGTLLVQRDFKLLGEELTVPFSFTVEPGDTHKSSEIRITALALGSDDIVLVERSVRVGFVDQQRRLLSLPLLRNCEPVVCADRNETCLYGNCVDNLVDVRGLPVVNPGEEFSADAGPFPTNADGGASNGDGATHDTGMLPPEVDGGTQDASITGPVSSCLNTGCPSNQVCVNPRIHSFCDANPTRAADCECRQACDPFGAVLRCGLSNDICSFISGASPEGQGFCTPDRGGGEQDDVCSAFFNSKGEHIADDCNRERNFTCAGVSAGNPDNGRCARVCRTDLFLNCQFLLSETTYECTNVSQDQSSILGTCRLPRQEHNDISDSCFTGFDCLSQSCLVPGTRGICTSQCGGLETCPSDSTCLTIRDNSEIQFLCFRECETDVECSVKNRNNVCHTVGDRKICYPRCNLTNLQCPGSQGRCNRLTGHCE